MTNSPEEFDLEAWVKGVKSPERSVTVYQRPDIIAELDLLERQIKNARLTTQGGEASIGERRSLRALEADYQRLAQEFSDSALTLRMRLLSDEEKTDVVKKAKKGDINDVSSRIWAATIVSPKLTPKQAGALLDSLDPRQFENVNETFKSLHTDLPSVSADFLRESSGRESGTD